MKIIIKITAISGIIIALFAPGQAATLNVKQPAIANQPRLQALSITPAGNIWVSGTRGKILYSSDRGNNWTQKNIPLTDKLQFRDIWANDNEVFVLAAGSGNNSRIYHSGDNGKSWQLQYQMPHQAGFINCFDFWDSRHAMVFGDSIGKQVFILTTDDGGQHWQQLTSAPLAQAGGEGGFAASGSCLRVKGKNEAWIATGASKQARLLTTNDRGTTWQSQTLQFPSGPTAGIFSVIPESGWAFGGRDKTDLKLTALKLQQQQWQKVTTIPLDGAIYGSDSFNNKVIVVNPGGVALSENSGKSWLKISDDAYWATEFDKDGIAWLVGPNGRISTIE